MLRESHTAIVARNERWTGEAATEPFEAGWASEAIFFLRALAAEGAAGEGRAHVQISPDGIRWVDEGTSAPVPGAAEGIAALRVAHFGSWLRLRVELPAGAALTPVVTLSLKA
jgi:hypothetical protein